MTLKPKVSSSPITALLISLPLLCLSACSSHVAPNSDDIKQAISERGANVSTVTVNQCQRHNGVDDGNDPHFDWYGCYFTATIDGTTKSDYGTFISNSAGWHMD